MAEDIILGVRFLNYMGRRDPETPIYYYKISKETFDTLWISRYSCSYWYCKDNFADTDDGTYLIENEMGYNYRESRVTIEEIVLSQEQIDTICFLKKIRRLVKIIPASNGVEYQHQIKIVNKDVAIKESNTTTETEIEIEIKRGKSNMFENIFKGVDFGKANDVVFSINGPAFKTVENTYITKDKEGEGYTEVTGLTFNEIDTFYYKIPVSKNNIAVGDYIRHNDCWVRVIEVLDNNSLRVDKIFERERIEVFPTKNIFGFDFYTKLVDLTGGSLFAANANEDNPFGNILPFLLLSGNDDSNLKDMLPLILLNKDAGNEGIKNLFPLMLLSGDNKQVKDMLPLMVLSGNNIFGNN